MSEESAREYEMGKRIKQLEAELEDYTEYNKLNHKNHCLQQHIDELKAENKLILKRLDWTVACNAKFAMQNSDLELKVKELEAQLSSTSEAFSEAIQFALKTDEPRTFLHYWNEGEWDVLRRDWPEFAIHKSLELIE